MAVPSRRLRPRWLPVVAVVHCWRLCPCPRRRDRPACPRRPGAQSGAVSSAAWAAAASTCSAFTSTLLLGPSWASSGGCGGPSCSCTRSCSSSRCGGAGRTTNWLRWGGASRNLLPQRGSHGTPATVAMSAAWFWAARSKRRTDRTVKAPASIKMMLLLSRSSRPTQRPFTQRFCALVAGFGSFAITFPENA